MNKACINCHFFIKTSYTPNTLQSTPLIFPFSSGDRAKLSKGIFFPDNSEFSCYKGVGDCGVSPSLKTQEKKKQYTLLLSFSGGYVVTNSRRCTEDRTRQLEPKINNQTIEGRMKNSKTVIVKNSPNAAVTLGDFNHNQGT